MQLKLSIFPRSTSGNYEHQLLTSQKPEDASGQLLEIGVATAPRDVLLRTPLHLAAMNGKDGIFKKMTARGSTNTCL